MELPPWPKKLDPWLQRTVWGLGITLGVLTLMSNYIVPHFEVFMSFTYIAYAALYAYLWYRNWGVLNSWSIQFILVPCIVISLIDAVRYTGRGVGMGCWSGAYGSYQPQLGLHFQFARNMRKMYSYGEFLQKGCLWTKCSKNRFRRIRASSLMKNYPKGSGQTYEEPLI